MAGDGEFRRLGSAGLLVAVAVITALWQSRTTPVAAASSVTPLAVARETVFASPSPSPPSPPLIKDEPSGPPAPERERPEAPDAPARTRPIAPSAGRARPPNAKTARPAAVPSADELLRRAQEKFDIGETEAAGARARQAAGAGAGAPAHVLMGQVLMSERRFDEAEQEFAAAVRLDPGDARAARMLALVRETRGGGR